jgi:hypothetical protein
MKNIGDRFWLLDAKIIDGEFFYDKEATQFEVTEHCMKSVMAKCVKTGKEVRVSHGYKTKEFAEHWIK